MPLFRRPRALLDESLETTIIVRNKAELKKAITEDWAMWLDHPAADHSNFKHFEINIFRPFDLTLEQSFDKRCGWFTHYVSADIMCKDEFHMVGFLSEPLEE